MSTVNIGIVSFAHMHAASYAACLNALPDATLVGICDADEARGRAAAQAHHTRYYAQVASLLDEGLDGVIICSENVYHRSTVDIVAPRVEHILCEKPLATTLDNARAMLSACERYGAKLQTAFPVRFAPPVQSLKRLLDEGALGTPVAASCTNHGRMPGGWFTERELSGGGAVIDHTVHVIDLLRWFWSTEVTEVYADIGSSLLHPELGIDDAGLLSFKLANGVYGTLDTSWSRPPTYPTWGDVKLELLGTEGTVRVDAFRQHLSLTNESGTQYLNWGSSPDMGLIKDFTEMIRTGREPSVTGEDGLRALEVALAAYRSAQRREVVRLAHSQHRREKS